MECTTLSKKWREGEGGICKYPKWGEGESLFSGIFFFAFIINISQQLKLLPYQKIFIREKKLTQVRNKEEITWNSERSSFGN
jgi:hypothetical protein